MDLENMEKITVAAFVNAPIEKVWDAWTKPDHITKWNNANDDWHTTKATNDLRVGGKFSSRMEAKDVSMGFDFGGTYTELKNHKGIAYEMEDQRMVNIDFTPESGGVRIVEVFDADSENPADMQRAGWQAILNNFKRYVENLNS